ncbi:hypothetical protein AB0K00_19860 [Dactylosporangium sp. NPDC049525]|uniref:hypothetical protein n=1 Tax=Dactylosporangium sp. NPDC049525 TaxID=3154730 RepID=UPI00341CD902
MAAVWLLSAIIIAIASPAFGHFDTVRPLWTRIARRLVRQSTGGCQVDDDMYERELPSVRRRAGHGVADGDSVGPVRQAGTQAVKVFDLVAAGTGLRDHAAREAGCDPVTVATTADDHKAYYPGATPIQIRVTGDRMTGRLLGAQLLGHRGAEIAKRIDIFATAISYGAKVADIAELDLSYTPPLGSPWDAVQIAGTNWLRTAD